jgi:hypothetical protein
VSIASLSGQGTCTLPKPLIALTLLHQTTPPHSNRTPTSTSKHPARSPRQSTFYRCCRTLDSTTTQPATPQPPSHFGPQKQTHTVNRILVGLPSRYCSYSQLIADSLSLVPQLLTQLPITDFTNTPTPPLTTLLVSSPPHSRYPRCFGPQDVAKSACSLLESEDGR